MITTDESAVLLRQMLDDAGFNFDWPDPHLAWNIFKKFARIPVNCAQDGLLFQTSCSSYPGEEEIFEFDMTRQYMLNDDQGEYCHMEHLTLTLSCGLIDQLKEMEQNLWAEDFPSLDEYFAAVEKMPNFRIGVQQKYRAAKTDHFVV